jgi:hypothetical protein
MKKRLWRLAAGEALKEIDPGAHTRARQRTKARPKMLGCRNRNCGNAGREIGCDGDNPISRSLADADPQENAVRLAALLFCPYFVLNKVVKTFSYCTYVLLNVVFFWILSVRPFGLEKNSPINVSA